MRSLDVNFLKKIENQSWEPNAKIGDIIHLNCFFKIRNEIVCLFRFETLFCMINKFKFYIKNYFILRGTLKLLKKLYTNIEIGYIAD